MTNEIFILCNSPQCLAEISAGNYPNLHEKNLFTCNLAYSFFRTNKRHLNIFSDRPAIIEFLTHNNWFDVYSTHPYNEVEFIINTWCFNNEPLVLFGANIKGTVKHSEINVPGSSGMNALLHLVNYENFDKIHLIGYTLREWSGIKHVKELQGKLKALNSISERYEIENPRDFVYTYTKRKLKP